MHGKVLVVRKSIPLKCIPWQDSKQSGRWNIEEDLLDAAITANSMVSKCKSAKVRW